MTRVVQSANFKIELYKDTQDYGESFNFAIVNKVFFNQVLCRQYKCMARILKLNLKLLREATASFTRVKSSY